MSEDTVFALSSPVGGAIAIVRITGSGAYVALGRVFRCKNAPEHRVMNYGHVIDPESGETIDSAMACFLKAPATYTGEDMAEIYIHGSRVIAKRTLSVLSRFLRPAEGGEFTKRAFMNGKLDLSQAEAVMDVISSVTEQGARMAEEQLEGSIGSGIKDIEDRLIDILSGVEAALDYPEELEEDTVSALGSELAPIMDKLDYLIRGGNAARIFREGASVAILGAPNAGKSSLFNALMGTERAIVTSIPGTTRDTLEETLDICGAPVRITDTAGIREGADEAERIGAAGVSAALSGETGKMRAFRRISDIPYIVDIVSIPAELTANHEKAFPKEWITFDGTNVTESAYKYFLPLIQGENVIRMKNGMPVHFKIREDVLK